MNKRALITGVTGQDGSYLADLLLQKGYQVYGMYRHTSVQNFERIQQLLGKITLVPGDLTDSVSLASMIETIQPNEIYNLAAQSFVPVSWEQPVMTSEVDAIGVTRLLSLLTPEMRFYQASTSEMFGDSPIFPQNESTPFEPNSPYSISKTYAHWMTASYRQRFNLFAVSGILFNHESERRGLQFVTRKVTHTVAKIALGKETQLHLGNLDSCRDWGYAPDYVEAIWRMLQTESPDDYVIATGISHSIRDLAQIAFGTVGLNWKDYVVYDEDLVRSAEQSPRIGDFSKARNFLDWTPTVSFEEMIVGMVIADIDRLKAE